MAIADALLAEFEQEAQSTRKFLERVPEDKITWKPHDKSMSLGQLALHIATVPAFIIQFVQEDVVPAPNFGQEGPTPGNVEEILAAFDQSVTTVKEILPTFDDNRMQGSWTVMKDDDTALVSMPRVVCIRSLLLNHWYHHRGQISVYLRLLDTSVPSAYGPSADELPDFLKA